MRIARLTAIAEGLASATIKARLQAAEEEIERLKRENVATSPKERKVTRLTPDIAARYEKIVTDAERALTPDWVRPREALRGYVGEIKCSPKKGDGLIAESRVDGFAIMCKSPGIQRHITAESTSRVT